MKPVPILFVSDSPELPTGLGRITKDLATQCATLPEFRVGVFGRGGIGSSRLPFAQYSFNELDQWGEGLIQDAWLDFAGGDQGVIMSIWDVSRLHWFARPRMGGKLQQFLTSGMFQKWGYFPIDSHGVGGKLTGQSCDALHGFDRVLAYTIFGKQVLEASMGEPVDFLPHGFNGKVFQPRDRSAGRSILGVDDTDILVGMVATNQSRKDWGTAFGAMAKVKNVIPNVKFWVHVDILERYWNIRALADDFGLSNTVRITLQDNYSSEQLSYLYSACNLTFLSSLGEGHGFPIVESQACGVPVLHTNYAGGAQFVAKKYWLVDPKEWRLDGLHNLVRPVLDPESWADKIIAVLDECAGDLMKDECVQAMDYLRWDNLWSPWRSWLLKGIER